MELSAEQLRLYLITDDRGREPGDLAGAIEWAIAGGVTCVQFREKSASAVRNSEAFMAVAEVCRAYRVPLLLNADLAGQFIGWEACDGIHYSSRTLPSIAEPTRQPSGFSAHSADDIRMAQRHSVTFCVLSCIFEVPGKTDEYPPLGLSGLQLARAALPDALLLALGGVTPANAADCIRAGANGVAVMRSILSATDPEAAARSMRAEVDSALAGKASASLS